MSMRILTLLRRMGDGPEPFILTAMLSLLGGSLWLFQERELMLGHFYRPEFLSITHTLTLGWVSMLMMGILAKLLPRFLGVGIRSTGLLRLQFASMVVGFTGMVFHFLVSGFLAMASAAVLVVIAASIQWVNCSAVVREVRDGNWLSRYVAAAMIHLILAAVLGVFLGFNKVYDLLSGEFFPSLFAHIHLAALGWVGLMIVGFQHRLLPISRPDSIGWAGKPAVRFWVLEIGILGLAASLLLGSPMAPVFTSLVWAGIALHAWRPLRLLVRGRVRDRASIGSVVAMIFLVVDGTAGWFLSLGLPPEPSPLRYRIQLAYGYVALYGWITLTISSTIYKLFPIFVWEERFKKDWGRTPVPAMRNLYSSTLQTLSATCLTVGVVGVAAGVVLSYLPLISFFHGVVILGVVALVINFILMERWALGLQSFVPGAQDRAHFQATFPEAPPPPND